MWSSHEERHSSTLALPVILRLMQISRTAAFIEFTKEARTLGSKNKGIRCKHTVALETNIRTVLLAQTPLGVGIPIEFFNIPLCWFSNAMGAWNPVSMREYVPRLTDVRTQDIQILLFSTLIPHSVDNT